MLSASGNSFKKTFMHALSVSKQAALEAMDPDEETPGDTSLLHSITDPHTALELVRIVETRITEEEVESLHHVIGQLSNYIRRVSPTPEAVELVRHAKAVVGVTSR